MAEKKSTTTAKSKPKPFALPDKKVNVRYVKRQTGYITNPKHVAYGGKLEGSKDVYYPKMGRNGKYTITLTDVEQSYLENMLGMNEGDLSVYKKDNNFWDTFKVILGKEGVVLDLSDPFDYLKYKVLLAYDDVISPSITETSDKLTYKYELVTAKDEQDLLKKTINYDMKAYKMLSEIEDSREKLVGVLRVMTGKRVSTESDHDWLIAKVGNELKANPKRFIEILEDEDYQIKLLIEQAIDDRKIIKSKGLYRTVDGLDLCEPGQVPTLDNAIMFLSDPKNQDIKLLIKSK